MRLRSNLKASLARYVRVPSSSALQGQSTMPSCGPCKFSFLHFRPFPVTIFTAVIYLALFIPLLIIHYVPPSPPSNESLKDAIGVDLTATWRSLSTITKSYHPYNSHANDEVRAYLVDQIQQIIDRNGGANYSTVVEDTTVNVLYAGSYRVSIYFESLNILVKVEGSGGFEGQVGDVLVNAHYDSVSTAPGATDDGVAVVTVLGLIDYFTQPAHIPRRSIYFLLNNGEEDYLNGAMAFTEHPWAKTCRIFLNLEGAGAGGRATLFRSTDAEVTQFFKQAKYPFGTSLSGDAFKRGVIRSQTDYIIFDGELGMRGLDVAFWQPRARYHTQWDSMAYTSINSLWHMFETSLSSVIGMANDKTYTFIEGSGRKHPGVWFDMFGRGFALFQIYSAFVGSMCLLTLVPAIFILVIYLLAKTEKLYLLSSSPKSNGPLPAKLELAGWRGFWRPIIAFILAGGATFGVGILIAKVNPLIMYSSQEAVWICLASVWIIVAWFIVKIGSIWRPSATAKTWAFSWVALISWLLLVINAVAIDRLDVGGLYFFIFYYLAAAISLLLCLLSYFILPPTSTIYDSLNANGVPPLSDDEDDRGSFIAASVDGDRQRHPVATSIGEQDDEEPTEQTSLLRDSSNLGRGRHIGRRPNSHGSLSIGGASSTIPTIENNDDDEPDCSLGVNCSQRQYPGEQHWSRNLPKYTWILQALVSIPIPVIITAQVALIVGTSIAQTGADGNPPGMGYMMYAFFTVLVLVPLLPFLHRWTRHVPVFLFLVFVGTLLYLLLAFPFSLNSPLKVYFSQTVDLSTGQNNVNLVGVGKYIRQIVEENIPSAWAAGEVRCAPDPLRLGLERCSWPGYAPAVVPGKSWEAWVSVNVTSPTKKNKNIKLDINVENSRGCRVLFDRKVANISVSDPTGRGTTTVHGGSVPAGGTDQLRLWSREWGRGWTVEVTDAEDSDSNLKGTVQCLWSDANEKGVIPALDEIKRFLPNWAVVSKLEDGLVVGQSEWTA